MGSGPGSGIEGAEPFVIDGVEFVPGWVRPSQPGSFTLLKGPAMVDAYRTLLAPFPRPRMVELGISKGGSVALLTLLARPTRFVAVELDPDPIPALDAFLAERGLAEDVRPHFGVDQGDRARLAEIVRDAFGHAPLDVVIDDASHHYPPTLASFEVLFPRLRPGGVYVIEDWTAQDALVAAVAASFAADPAAAAAGRLLEQVGAAIDGRADPEPPMSLLAVELAIAQAQSAGAIASVVLDENWIRVTRGPAVLPDEGFTLAGLYADHFRLLATTPSPWPADAT